MERELKLILSLDMAKKWYKSNDTELKTLALSVYTEDELTTITMDDIINATDDRAYHSFTDKIHAYLNILIVARYFNNNWNKKDDEIGYFYSYNNHTDSWDIKQHNTVTYTGIVYYKTKEIAEKAFEISKKFYELLR